MSSSRQSLIGKMFPAGKKSISENKSKFVIYIRYSFNFSIIIYFIIYYYILLLITLLHIKESNFNQFLGLNHIYLLSSRVSKLF